MQYDCVGHWDEPLCRAIQQWAAAHAPPDGTQEWEDALMAVAIPAATLRVSCGSAPAYAYRRRGALHTLRWLLPRLSFKARPGALDPDPLLGVAERADQGYCVCGCRVPPGTRLSDADLQLGGPLSEEQRGGGNGAVPFCRIHGERKGPTPFAVSFRRTN